MVHFSLISSQLVWNQAQSLLAALTAWHHFSAHTSPLQTNEKTHTFVLCWLMQALSVMYSVESTSVTSSEMWKWWQWKEMTGWQRGCNWLNQINWPFNIILKQCNKSGTKHARNCSIERTQRAQRSRVNLRTHFHSN